jgi:HSP20 family protein
MTRDELHDVDPDPTPGEERESRMRRRNYVRPEVDIYSTDSEMVVTADVPGVGKKDLNVTLDRDELVIEAVAAGRADDESSLPWGYYRRFRLRTSFDRDAITAHVEGGILEITLPKAASEQPKSVTVD